MKRFTLSMIFIGLATVLFAQKTISIDEFSSKADSTDPDHVQTVMSNIELKRISAFGGPMMTYTQLAGEYAFMMGGGGGIIVNNMYFGGYGTGVSNSVQVKNGENTDQISFGHGGFMLGYEIAHQKVIHPVISSKIGWGQAALKQNYSVTEDNVFVVAPSIAAEINLTRYFKMNIGVEYCKTFGVSGLNGYSDKDFSNIGVNLNFVFGWF